MSPTSAYDGFPPNRNAWILLAYWTHGTGQQLEAGPHTGPPSYVIDHFSQVGSASITGYWDKIVMNSEMRDLLKSTGRSIFENSLELDATTFWTLNFSAEFVERMGYNVLNGVPVIIREKEKQPFTFADSDMARGALKLLERVWPAIY
ncbi:uncharacterized protein K441DRAFT_700326 [Cenococcum geophilum 1.58]|uniref:uncharacterized protein n=1 Tax=Cenococcum geophilum 1.58 TaxID=794803 RepID=UPI0035901DD6|nr:hypothetical protein K441DRAFT_700326 [Cenococcum geophilum 1.58]